MPPKQSPKQGSSSKVKDDKTFGMKNKNKSAKVQKQVQIMQQQAAMAGKNKETLAKEKEKELRAKAKAEEEKKKKEEAELFKTVQVAQKIPFGVDPKTVLCMYFKTGHCDKGNKCKFSHDLNVGRKTEKRNVYSDTREEKLKDTMDTWDEEKLRNVILSKHGNPRTTTDIVCKFFIEAIEKGMFGWFWECPNGGEKCMYKHALPPGFVLKSQKKADESKKDEISLEDFLEVERHKLGKNLTPVTRESFDKWKQTRQDKKMAEEEAMRAAKSAQAAAGKSNGMSGRDLFTFNPEWFQEEEEEEAAGDEEGWDIAAYRRQRAEEDEREEERRIREMNEEFRDLEVDDVHDTGEGGDDGEEDEGTDEISEDGEDT
ncbi:hypothetical protein DACRYDRAFT_20523 [Dacryopinax primogenitus]|uniref:Zinc finger CCCH domain-containing protein 15 n=1 Tax=Dacryopinax primogenitus (strain DJM 731) TaxID=1858805 RepID=M5G3X2_DACPD|nr:uncharacterized protein DACRYDRAFT_20523 [Dacryopinax primogenitus]EJU04951.1 hypothetical protein DACRYDRAFT_20523 [Dacryopinax primogenitus]